MGASMASKPPEIVLHGGDLDAARRRFPEARQHWIDLSTAINPIAYRVSELSADVWSRLPLKMDEGALREVACRRYGVGDPAMVVPAPGTQSLIQVIPRLREPAHVAVLGPTYGEHVAAWRREGHETAEIKDLSAVGEANIVVLVNPNNPTGHVVAADEVRDLAETLRRRDGWLIVDEAFADVMPTETSVASNLPPATIVMRSLGKTYGLAGVRLGFSISSADIAAQIADALGPWAVSGPALAIGRTALADDMWLNETRDRLQRDAQRLENLLVTEGFHILGGTPLFRLAAHADAQSIADMLGQHGIHVRRFPEQPEWLRFGLAGPEDDWRRLEQALSDAQG